MIINNSPIQKAFIELPGPGIRYTLSSRTLRSGETLLNGRPLTVLETAKLPALEGESVKAGELELSPMTVTFLTVEI